MSSWNDDKHDQRQRSYGFIGLSVMAHVGVLAIMAVLPKTPSPESTTLARGNNGSDAVYMELQTDGAAATEPQTVSVSEPAPPAPATEAIEVTTPEPVSAAVQAPAAPVLASVPKLVPKPAIQAPAQAEVIEDENNDLKVQEALRVARTSDQEEPHESASNSAEPIAENTETQAAIATDKTEENNAPAFAPLVPMEEGQAKAVETSHSGTTSELFGPSSGGGMGSGLPAGTTIRDARDLIAKPGNAPPSYPVEDRRLGRQGNNILLARIQADGSVADVVLEKSSGSPYMDSAAIQAFRQWKFMPGQAGWVRQPFAFNLTGNAKEMPARLRRR